MTPEQRLDRLERIAKLFVRAGLRARSEFRKQNEILMDAQMRNEARFERNEERFALYEERFARNEERSALYEERFARNEERFARNEERSALYEERFARNEERSALYEERFARNEELFARLAESQIHTDRRLDALIEIVRKRNGSSSSNS